MKVSEELVGVLLLPLPLLLAVSATSVRRVPILLAVADRKREPPPSAAVCFGRKQSLMEPKSVILARSFPDTSTFPLFRSLRARMRVCVCVGGGEG